jgi:transcriptional regulator with XRE-family HTH domain
MIGVDMTRQRNHKKTKIEHAAVVTRFAHRLKELRVERGMTQAELAEKAKVTATYVSKLESAGAAPGIDLVENLAVALGVGVTDLIPISQPADPLALPREQARALFDSLMKTADSQTLALLNPFLLLLAESSGRRSNKPST